MNNSIYFWTRIGVLLFLQVLVFDSLQLYGYVVPYVYIMYIFWLPDKMTPWQIILSFFLGLFIDVFSDSYGIHTLTGVCIVYIRPILTRLFFGYSYLDREASESQKKTSSRIYYMLSILFLHQLLLFTLEVFDITKIINILMTTVISVAYTAIMILIMSPLFRKSIISSSRE